MVRPLRIEILGGSFHVTSRGDRREAIYLADADRRYWLSLLGEVCERFQLAMPRLLPDGQSLSHRH